MCISKFEQGNKEKTKEVTSKLNESTYDNKIFAFDTYIYSLDASTTKENSSVDLVQRRLKYEMLCERPLDFREC